MTTWVLQDYNPNAVGELAVSRGQQVEVLDLPSTSMAMIRLILPGTNALGCPGPSSGVSSSDRSSNATPVASEGLVPILCLKQPPGGFKAHLFEAGTYKNENKT